MIYPINYEYFIFSKLSSKSMLLYILLLYEQKHDAITDRELHYMNQASQYLLRYYCSNSFFSFRHQPIFFNFLVEKFLFHLFGEDIFFSPRTDCLARRYLSNSRCSLRRNSREMTRRKEPRQARKKTNEEWTWMLDERKQLSIVFQFRSI
jgi:hypothetical protein